MTCVIGMVRGGYAHLIADRSGLDGTYTVMESDCKIAQRDLTVWPVAGGVDVPSQKRRLLFGLAGDPFIFQRLSYAELPPLHEAYSFEAWLVRHFIPLVKQELDGMVFESAMLIAYQGELWELAGEKFPLRRCLDFAALGAGSNISIGAMAMLVRDIRLSPQDVLTEAAAITYKYSIAIRPPFDYFTTEGVS